MGRCSVVIAVLLTLTGPVGASSVPPQRVESSGPAEREKVQVEEVLAMSDGQFVVLLKTVAAPARYLPIWIGASEAMAIRLKLDRQEPPRPLTLNLLESVMAGGKIELDEILIEAMSHGVFLGRITVHRGATKWSIDSRPSDAIGLAVGKDVPIWVSRTVLEDAAFEMKKSEEHPPDGASVSYEDTL